MTILIAYLISVGVSTILLLNCVNAANKRQKREGYVSKKSKKSFSENIIDILYVSPVFLCPIVNLVCGIISVVNFEKIYQDYTEQNLRENLIYKKEETIPEIEEKIINLIKDYEINPVRITDKLKEDGYIDKHLEEDTSIPTFKRKTYSEMSTREKISYLKEEEQALLELQKKDKEAHTLTLGMH